MIDMSASTFKAVHCGETFVGAEGARSFVAHMKDAHKVTKPPTASWAKATPSWVNPKPLPWKAPKAPTDTRGLTAVLAGASPDDVLEWTTDDKSVPVAELRSGDAFVFNGRTYTVDAVEGDTLALTMKRPASHGGNVSSKLTREQIASKTTAVAIVKRAA